jgi:predicted regulator of Ras-like GTPase activity (Roadblock/LC7/MglB family)
MSKLDDLIAKFRADISHFISTDIVHLESGLSLGGGSDDPNFDAAVASASYSEVLKANSHALDLIGVGGSSTEDILITTGPALILIRMIGSEHFLVVAISRQGSLGYTRNVMKKFEPLFLQTITSM